ncbi:PAS domain S-box protein [Xanthomonadaceae bacterium JHOS43]|nr:PAS domain S-box protein [Xanthomonadaceae bacterium JHOS43]
MGDRAALVAERESLLQRLRDVEAILDAPGHAVPVSHMQSSWQAVLNALPAHIALLDPDGCIVAVNEAWRRFAVANAFPGDAFGVGQNYLSVCAGARGEHGDEARDVHHGIRAVLAGESAEFSLEYPCHSPDTRRWFRMTVTPIHPAGSRGCVVMHLDITDRKLAEESLRSSEVRMRAILDVEPECIKAVSAEGVILSINEAGVRLFGVDTADEIVGKPMLGHIHPDNRSAYAHFHDSVVAGNGGVLRYRIVDARGKVKLVESHSTPLHDDGRISARVSVTRDVTERKLAEERLENLRKLNQHVLDSVGEGIQGVDLDGRITFANPAAESILGWREDEITGSEAHLLFHHHRLDGSAYPDEDCPIYRTLRDGIPRRIDDECFFHRDGRAIPVEYVVTPVLDADGTLHGAVICFRDISGRLADQAALARSEERYRLVARATAVAIWDWNVATAEVLWNDGLQNIFGYAHAGGRTHTEFWADCIHLDDRERVTDSLDRFLKSGRETWEREYRFRRRDGSYAVVIDRGVVVRDADGEAVRMVGGMTDISEMRALEAQLRVSQRLEAVGQLTGGLAHDFNNLLTVVLGNAELLEERLAHVPGERDLARMILSAAQRGAALTQRLLAFARRQALEARPVLLGELVHGMEHLVRRAIGDEITLEVIATKGNGCVLVDAAQLENALLNLCINARDAMPEGGRLVITVSEVTLAPPDIDPLSHSQQGDYVCLEVLDAGTGIPEDILSLVIEPFFTTKEQDKGTGLGLSMVYGLVKQSNGFLDIQSRPGTGTRVRIHLPRYIHAPVHSGTTKPDASIAGGSERILLVDDDSLVRRYACLQLRGLGYQVTVAEGGVQGLELLKGPDAFDLLITDMMMPGGVNGAKLAEEARALRPDLRILFSSGGSMDALSSGRRLPEGIPMLPKPYTKAELAQRVREALS